MKLKLTDPVVLVGLGVLGYLFLSSRKSAAAPKPPDKTGIRFDAGTIPNLAKNIAGAEQTLGPIVAAL